MLFGYFDSSGHHRGSKILTLCGWLGEMPAFERMHARWNAVLHRKCWRNRLSEFHVCDCVYGSNEFEGWSYADRLTLCGLLSDVLAESSLLALGSVVVIADLALLSREDLQLLNGQRQGRPIDLALTYVLQQSMVKVREFAETEDLAILFDEEPNDIARDYLEFSHHFETNFGHVFKGIAFGDSKKFSAIQAADMLAYGTYLRESEKRFPEEFVERDLNVVPVINRMLEKVSSHGGVFTIDSLRKLVQMVREKSGTPFRL